MYAPDISATNIIWGNRSASFKFQTERPSQHLRNTRLWWDFDSRLFHLIFKVVYNYINIHKHIELMFFLRFFMGLSLVLYCFKNITVFLQQSTLFQFLFTQNVIIVINVQPPPTVNVRVAIYLPLVKRKARWSKRDRVQRFLWARRYIF